MSHLSRRQAAGAVLLTALITGASVFAQSAPTSDTDARIRFYKARLGGPGTYPAYARLGAAYIQKGRETGRQSYYDQAVQYLSTSLGYQRNYEAILWLAAAQLARHEFREALNYAQEAVETMPRHLSAQGALFDSYLALGQVEDAEIIAEQMLALKPGLDAYARLATIREYRGDLAGAVRAMEKACSLANTPGTPTETRAWCDVRLGSLYLLAHCDADRTEAAYNQALKLYPDYHRATEHMAELRAAQGRHDEALALYRKVLTTTADPVYRVMLADVYQEKQKHQTANRTRQRALEELRRVTRSGSRAYLRPLALLLLDQSQTAAEGLYWARKDWEHRRDAFAADTLAWAHHHNGNDAAAMETISQALRAGTKDATILVHAAVIHMAANQRSKSGDLVEQVLLCPLVLRSADRDTAKKLLKEAKQDRR